MPLFRQQTIHHNPTIESRNIMHIVAFVCPIAATSEELADWASGSPIPDDTLVSVSFSTDVLLEYDNPETPDTFGNTIGPWGEVPKLIDRAKDAILKSVAEMRAAGIPQALLDRYTITESPVVLFDSSPVVSDADRLGAFTAPDPF